jgi:hypothetical protein
VRTNDRNGRGSGADNGHRHPEHGAVAKQSLIREANQKGSESSAEQVYAAVDNGHRLASHAVGHCQLHWNEHDREHRACGANGNTVQTYSNVGTSYEGDRRQVCDLNQTDATE